MTTQSKPEGREELIHTNGLQKQVELRSGWQHNTQTFMNALSHHNVIISSDVLSQEVAGETVLLDLVSEHYFGLDAIGTLIWQRISNGIHVDEAIYQIMQDYDVSRAQLEADVEALLIQLQRAGILTAESPDG